MIFSKKVTNTIFSIAALLSALFLTVNGAPPHPQLLDELKASNKQLPYYLEHNDELKERGVCAPERFFEQKLINEETQLQSPAATPFRILAILVKFTDHPSSAAAPYFDSLVFSANGSTVRSYFSSISYTQIDLVTLNLPSALGWRTAPQTYSYYVNGQNGLGAYPRNTQKLVEDLSDQINPLVNFANYDNDGDGFVDVLLMIHSGVGAEFSGSSSDIWSHKWGISPRLKDGVYIRNFTIQPEYWITPGDMTIGVYAHELCHGFGLPDLYDIDNSSNGVGKWCIMSYGSWNGPYPGGGSPSHPCAWSRIEMGFKSWTNVTASLNSLAISDVKTGGPIYRLWTCGQVEQEYFLLENRQKTGFDTYLPQSGLLVWHIDDNKLTNTQEWFPGLSNDQHYKVALEQADGFFELEHHVDIGDAGDPFPGSGNKISFSSTSSPNSNSYSEGATNIRVSNINMPGNVVTADISSGLFGCCCGVTGDVNGDGVNAGVEDINFLVAYIFRSSQNPGPCPLESDINNDNLGPNILDLEFLLNRVFRGGAPLPYCS